MGHEDRHAEYKLTFHNTGSPGIDVATLIGLGSAITNALSLFEPWLIGLNNEYLPGTGLTYSIVIEVNGIELIQTRPYLLILIIPIVLTGFLVLLAITPDDFTSRLNFKRKALILLTVSIPCSIFPSFSFLNELAMGADLMGALNVFVGRWELGSGATLPIYAGLGFALALLLRVFKD